MNYKVSDGVKSMYHVINTEQKTELESLLAEVWKNDQKMIDHCMRSSKYIYLNGKYIDCCDAKPTIHKTMWYDDEKENPGKEFDRFVTYNMFGVADVLADDGNNYLGRNYWRQTNDKLLNIRSFQHWQTPDEGLTKMTSEEVGKVNEAIKEVRTDFGKRLETYYRKYSDKIHSSGYWVNR